MEVGNRIINIVLASKDVRGHNNIFMTLAIGLAILNLFEFMKKVQDNKKWGLLMLAICLIPLGVICEGGMSLIPFIIISYFFRRNNKKAITGYVILSIFLFCIVNFKQYDTFEMTINMLMFNSDFLLITVVPFILLYNGERGISNKFSKYLFYVFYPLHLWTFERLSFFKYLFCYFHKIFYILKEKSLLFS